MRTPPWIGWSVGGVIIALLLLVPQSASAHTELVRSDPPDGAVLERSPNRIRLTFTEPIEPEFYGLEVYNASRARVDQRDARIPANNAAGLEVSLPPLEPGTYTIVWRLLSIDIHVVRGSLAFSVGAGTQPVPLLDLPSSSAPFEYAATVRWWTFLLAFMLVGSLGFGPLVLQPALRSARIVGDPAAQRARRRLLWIVWPAVIGLLVLSFGALLLQASEVSGMALGEVLGGRAITRLLTGTKYGTIWLLRMATLLGLLALVAVLSGVARPRGWLLWIGVGLGAAFLLTISLTGHASAVAQRTWLAVGADWIHLLAGAIWFGGLIQLTLVLLPPIFTLDAAQRRALLASAIRRFSLLAGVSVAALIVTGTYTGLIHVPNWQALLDTSYGAALSGKLLLFVPLLAIGAINLLVFHPRFVRAARTPTASGDPRGVRFFRRLVIGEVALAVLVLGVTGLLTGLPPASTEAPAAVSFRETQTVGDLNLTLAVDPNYVGANRIDVEVRDRQGQLVQAQRVAATLESLDMEMGQRDVTAQPNGPGRYRSEEVVLSMTGRWQATLLVEREGANLASATFAFTLGRVPGDGRPALSPLRILVNALTPGTVLGLLSMGVAGLIWKYRPNQRHARRERLVIATIVFVTGFYVLGASIVRAYRASSPMPVAATPETVARGEQFYAQNCVTCHGATGGGDGPAARALPRPPANLQIHMAAGHPDRQTFA